MATIHPTAMVSPQATLADSVTVGPGAIIEAPVTVGEDCEIGPYAIIQGHTTIGPRCRIYPSAIVGAEPQDFSYKGEPTETIIGNDNVLREFVTIHRGTAKSNGKTVIGSHNFMMAYTHVGHDSVIGDGNTLSNNSTLAGHSFLGSGIIIGGLSAIHQFCRIGDQAFIGGCSAVAQDIPPFFLASGNHAVTTGINKVGLQRKGKTEAEVRKLVNSFKIIYLRNKPLKEALDEIERTYGDHADVQKVLGFIRESKRGILRYGKPN